MDGSNWNSGCSKSRQCAPSKAIAELVMRTWAGGSERRSHPRFPLHCPVLIKFRSDGVTHEIECWTENVCTSGVLLESPRLIPRNVDVQCVISLRESFPPVQLKGAGRVVREQEHSPPQERFWIALQFKRPIRMKTSARVWHDR
jgi:hypothetical protein